ncbi:MAG: sulfate adenylyltransferase [Gemmatimonadetes bacterium]|nr:sulfate adenylyltransferase [Gemmatimonadota bacterium]
MIAPHGGVLLDRFMSGEDAGEFSAGAGSRPSITLNSRQVSDLRLIANGAFSPLEGFMGRADYEGVVSSASLANGLPWTIPVTLAVTPGAAARIAEGSEVSLRDGKGSVLGSLLVTDRYGYDKEREAKEVFRTLDEAHPGVANLYRQGDLLIGGPVRCMPFEREALYAATERSPAQTRALFEKNGWSTVVGFQTRNPIHRAHEYIMKCALELVDGLLVHPLVGETKSGDIGAEVRMRCYEVLLGKYYPADRTLLSVFPAFMRYAGPREAIFHAIVRKNYGCTHFIVGRDHAGVGSYYGAHDAQRIFREFDRDALGIQPLFFEHSFYCTQCGGMATLKTCPHPDECQLSLSGTKVREMLLRGQMPPEEFTRREVAEILIEAASERPLPSGAGPAQHRRRRASGSPGSSGTTSKPVNRSSAR